MCTMNKTESIVNRTLRTAVLIDTFWDRWVAHGIDTCDLPNLRTRSLTLDLWTQEWLSAAKRKEAAAALFKAERRHREAESMYRKASLCYNLIQWIYPERNMEKNCWYKECIRMAGMADAVSADRIDYETIEVDNRNCPGRIRFPDHPAGVVILVVPIDSAKEEMYTYEDDFVDAGFATVVFDGPGQGETYTFNGMRGTRRRWEDFMEKLIEFAAQRFPGLPLHLFGTSLGASWALYGSGHPKISSAAAVSPAVEFDRLKLPSYFLERMDCSCTLAYEDQAIPDFGIVYYRSPVLLFHGKKDQMVPTPDMHELYNHLTCDKQIIEFDEEGHCVNNRLEEVRRLSVKWFVQHHSLFNEVPE